MEIFQIYTYYIILKYQYIKMCLSFLSLPAIYWNVLCYSMELWERSRYDVFRAFQVPVLFSPWFFMAVKSFGLRLILVPEFTPFPTSSGNDGGVGNEFCSLKYLRSSELAVSWNFGFSFHIMWTFDKDSHDLRKPRIIINWASGYESRDLVFCSGFVANRNIRKVMSEPQFPHL